MEIQKPRGTEDIYDQKASEYSALELIIRNLISYYNFSEMKTPIFEFQELFNRGIGTDTDIIEKEMYEFQDKKNRHLVLRPEGTAPIVRAVLENKLYHNSLLPLKYFYFGSMFRYERPQKGRMRQFSQFGVEIIGVKNYLLDCELLVLAYNLIYSLGLKDISLTINFLPSKSRKNQYISKLKEYLSDKPLCQDCTIRLERNPLRVLDCKIDSKLFDHAPKTVDFLEKNDEEYFNLIQHFLKKLSIPFYINHNLVRGLDYYTSLVFELIDKSEKITIIGGGRYDDLFSLFNPKIDLPSVGFGLGIERLLMLLEKNNIHLATEKKLDVYLVCLSKTAYFFASNLAILLRSNEISCDMDYSDKNLKQQFKNAEKLNAENVIIIGDQELKNNYVTIKNQNTHQEENVTFEKIVSYLQKGE